MSCSATLKGIMKRSRLLLEWTSESEYFERYEFPCKIIKAKSYHLILRCVCVARGKKKVTLSNCTSSYWSPSLGSNRASYSSNFFPSVPWLEQTHGKLPGQ